MIAGIFEFSSTTVINLLSLAVVLLTVFWRTSAMMTRFDDSLKDVEKLSGRVDVMDEMGTQASRTAFKSGNELSISNAKQIAILTESLLKNEPQVARIMADLEWIKTGLRNGSFRSSSNPSK